MNPEDDWIPLFPLKTVLFPRGQLVLQIFEPRYISMIRDCAASGTPFAISLLVDDEDDEGHSTTAQVATLARIVDFFNTDKGLLGIRVHGEQRLEIQDTTVREDGLAFARGRFLADEPEIPLDAEYGFLATVARQLLEQAELLYPDYPEALLDDSSWVGCRLAELLPIALARKQVMLECIEPETRLDMVVRILPELASDD